MVFSIKKLKGFAGHNDVGFDLEGMEWTSYLLTEFKVLATYLRLIVLPINQNLDYDYPLSRGFFEPQTLFPFLLLSLLFVVAGCLLLKERSPSSKLADTPSPGLVVSFGICWFFLLLAPTSTFIPIIDVIFEHRAYLASWGIIAALVVTADATIRKINVDKTMRRAIAVSAIAVVMTSMALMLHKRAEVWKDKLSLWSDVVKKSPYKARAYLNLGHGLIVEKGCVEAWPALNQALRLAGAKNAVTVDALNNLAICSIEFGRNNEALRYAMRAAVMAPEAGDVKNTLGEIYFANKDYAKASEYFLDAIEIRPLASRYYNAALSFEASGEQGIACGYWGKYIDIEVDEASIRKVVNHMKDKGCS
jgi:tetratricopeptide (TPR) repeat protein